MPIARPSRFRPFAVLCASGMAISASAAPHWHDPDAGADRGRAFEISEDGHLRAVPETSSSSGGTKAGDVVPYGLVPDQEVLLRRQVGSLQIADLNGDGFNDLLAAVYVSNSFPPYTEFQDQVYFGNGSGIDLTPGWLSDDAIHTGDALIGDINGDTFPDIVTIHGGGVRSDNVRVYFGGASGPSTTAGYVSSTSPSAWGTAGVLVDIDNDNDLDLATTNQGLSPDPFRPVFLLRGNGSTLESSPSWISADTAVQNGIDAADINNDGFADLGVARWANFKSGIYLNNGTGTPESLPSIQVPQTAGNETLDRNAVFASLDGDSDLEIFYNSSSDMGRLYDITAPELTLVDTTTPTFDSAQETRVFDVDGDGDLDLAEIHFGGGRAHIYLNREGILDDVPAWTFDASEVGNSLAIGDLNNDGRPDLALGYSGDTSIRVFFAQAPACPGDIADDFGNPGGDGMVSFGDFLALLGLIGPCPGGTPGCTGDIADDFGTLGADGMVSFGDFLALLGLLGPCA